MRSCTWQERHAEDMLTLTYGRVKYGKTVQRIFLADLVHTVFIYAAFQIWRKYQEALRKFSLPCFVLFCFVFLSGCCGNSGR